MDTWLTTFLVKIPQDGFELAIKLVRMDVKYTQPDMDKLKEGRKQYDNNAEFLIATSQVITTHYQTVAKAKNFGKS